MGTGQLRMALWVGVITMLVWSAVLEGPFRFDDHLVPLDDPASQSLSALGQRLATTLRPVTKLSYALEASAGLADDAPSRRAVSVVIHACATALLALLLARIGGDERLGLLALLWALHPVHAESLLAVSGRSAVLSTALVVAALLAQLQLRAILAAGLYLLAVLARETAIAAVLPLLILAWQVSRDDGRHRAAQAAPLLLATVLATAWLLAVPRYRALGEYSFLGLPWAESVARQLGAIPQGLLLYVRPDLLSADHGTPLPSSFVSAGVVLGLCCLGLAAAGSWLAWRRGAAAVAFGLALWLAAIVPTQTLVPKLDPLTERPLGLALAGLVLVAAGVLGTLRKPVSRRAFALAVAPLATALAVATVLRGQLYASDVALWADAARKSVTNPRPHVNLGVALVAEGAMAEAQAAFGAALRIDPWHGQAARALAHVSRREE
jgi:hypothetical protein